MNDGEDTMSQIGTASRRPLIMFASAASFGIAALVASSTFVPTSSQARAAESQERNTPFSFNSQMEQFWRRFGMTDPRSDKWWRENFSLPRNSQMEQFLRRFGEPDDARASRAWLGVQIQPVTAEIADGLGMKGHDGALVVEPQEGSPAAKAGILVGDVITAVNGTAVKDASDLAKTIGGMDPGATIKLTVWRKGEEKSISLTLGGPSNSREARAWLGVQIQPVTAEIADSLGMKGHDGALIVEPQEGSPAAKAGILSGDVVTSVNGTAVKDAGELSKMIGGMTPGASAKLTVWRKGEEKNISLTLGETPKSRDTRTGDANSGPAGTDIASLGLSLESAAKVAGSGPDGLVVTSVDPDGVAFEHGMKTGVVILDIAGNKVAAPVDINKAISDAQKNGKRTILLRLKSDTVTKFVALPITRT
jgi:S1-C subfamily serine protease